MLHNVNAAPFRFGIDFKMVPLMLRRIFSRFLVVVLVAIASLTLVGVSPASAVLTDDHYDGNIFALYAGNGSLVPPKVSLAQSLKGAKPTLLVFYTDDSSDCKAFAPVVSQLDGFYGRAADFVVVTVDSIPFKSSYEPTEPGYYYQGVVPQTVLFDESGKVRLNEKGSIAYEKIDDVFREVFNLLPRSESVELRRRPVNEISTELAR